MLTQERAKELLTYDPLTGVLYRKLDLGGSSAGDVAGYTSNTRDGKKYRHVSVDGKTYKAHRLVWLITYGEFPSGQIDHIDGDGLNNRVENLRHVSRAENLQNQRRYANNTSGVSGVSWRKDCQKWVAHIRVNHKRIHLGYFADKSEAISARKAAEIKYGFHANHGTERPL